LDDVDREKGVFFWTVGGNKKKGEVQDTIFKCGSQFIDDKNTAASSLEISAPPSLNAPPPQLLFFVCSKGGFYKIQFDFYGFSCYLFVRSASFSQSSQRAALLPVARVTVTSSPHID
jgi:hypothetical protein